MREKTAMRQAASCEGKGAFDTWDEAERVQRRRRKSKRRVKTHVYRCEYCRRFHLATGDRS